MCRFVAYTGRPILLSDLVTRSARSLIHQSYRARERHEPLNGDGFGVGWYAPDIDPDPCVFTSITPAWSNRNLHNIAEKVRSPLVFAHVRAASPGLRVSEVNCHPFRHGRYLWMHNGNVGGFRRLRRQLRESLRDEYYDMIEGTTDSEHAFAVFLNELHGSDAESGLKAMEKALAAAVQRLRDWQAELPGETPTTMNFAVTDGANVAVTRYSAGGVPPESLYVSRGKRFVATDSGYDMVDSETDVGAAIVASEPLTDDASDWQPVAPNHMVSLSEAYELRVRALP